MGFFTFFGNKDENVKAVNDVLKELSVKPKTSEWAKNVEEEDRVEKLIRDSGCWDNHISVVECMMLYSDWRKCQNQVYILTLKET